MIIQDDPRLSHARDDVKAKGAGGTITKDNCALWKLLKLPLLGKLEGMILCHLLIFLPYCHLETRMTNSLTHTVWLVEIKDQPANAYSMTIRLVKRDNQLTNTCRATMKLVQMTKHLKIFGLQNVSYIVKTTLDATDGSLQQVNPESFVMNSFMRQSAILATKEFGSEVLDSDLDLNQLMQQHRRLLDILNLNNNFSYHHHNRREW